jgi:hypothetical protein
METSIPLYLILGAIVIAAIFITAWVFVKRAKRGNERLRQAQRTPKTQAHAEEPMS